jgi:hypothetical protein
MPAVTALPCKLSIRFVPAIGTGLVGVFVFAAIGASVAQAESISQLNDHLVYLRLGLRGNVRTVSNVRFRKLCSWIC